MHRFSVSTTNLFTDESCTLSSVYAICQAWEQGAERLSDRAFVLKGREAKAEQRRLRNRARRERVQLMSSPRRQTRNDAREENRLSTPPDRATSVARSISIQTSPLRTRGARTQYSNYGPYQQFIFTDQNFMFCAQCYIWDSETIKRRKLLLPLRWTTIARAKSLTVSAY
jgi:hypothetical protein